MAQRWGRIFEPPTPLGRQRPVRPVVQFYKEEEEEEEEEEKKGKKRVRPIPA